MFLVKSQSATLEKNIYPRVGTKNIDQSIQPGLGSLPSTDRWNLLVHTAYILGKLYSIVNCFILTLFD